MALLGTLIGFVLAYAQARLQWRGKKPGFAASFLLLFVEAISCQK